MKKNSIIVALLAMVVTFTSCQNFLDPEACSSMDVSVIFSDPALAEGALMGAYDVLGINNSYRNRAMIHTFSNSDVEMHNSSLNGLNENGRRAIAVFNINASNTEMNHPTNDPFSFAYMAIERLNIIIHGIRDFGDISVPAMAHVYGEALALRAFFYFDLIKWYGDVPARFEPINSETLFVGRTDRDEIFIQILEDLRIAAELLPWPGGAASYHRVDRINRAFAHSFRARVALKAGGYSLRAVGPTGGEIRLSNHPGLTALCPEGISTTPREAMYRIARNETAFMMANEGRGFRLEENFEQIFRDNMADVISVGRESIFQLPYNPGTRGQWLSFFGARHDGENMFTQVVVKGEAGPTPFMWHWFHCNDLRRDVSLVPFRYEASGNSNYARQLIQRHSEDGGNTPNARNWYFGRLRAEWGTRRMPSNDDGIQPIIMRFADVLLMFAEAQNELYGPTTPYNGVTAQDALRRVRARAFDGPDPLDFSTINNQATFFQAIMDERAFEFLGELRRKYDLNRWNMLYTRLRWAQRQTTRLRGEVAPGFTLDDNRGQFFPVWQPGDIDFLGTNESTRFPRHIFWRHVRCSCASSPFATPLCSGEHWEVEIFGLSRGEFPREGQLNRTDQTGTIIDPDDDLLLNAWLTSFEGATTENPWRRYQGTGNSQIEWIDLRDDVDTRPFSTHFIQRGFFSQGNLLGADARRALELRSLLPIWATPIRNSQGQMWNYFGY